jgi:hypothetical protein
MSRIRSIKPEFWASVQIVECSTNARLLFIGMWNFCDDLGRHNFSPKQLKLEVFPADDFTADDIRRMLDELSTNGLIIVYAYEDKEFLQVTGWHHQKIDRQQPARFRGPFDEGSTIIRGTLDERSRPIRSDPIRPEGIGEDRIISLSRARRGARDEKSIGKGRGNGSATINGSGGAIATKKLAGEEVLFDAGRPPPVFIEAETEEWNAWEMFYRGSRSESLPTPIEHWETKRLGWYFPTRMPP